MVRIVSKGGTSHGTKVFNSISDQEIRGIESITVVIQPNEIVRATVTLFLAEQEVDAIPSWHVIDPQSGCRRQVSRIVFADGGELRCEEGE